MIQKLPPANTNAHGERRTVPRILWWDSGSGLEARQWKARHSLLYSLFVSVGRLA
jgi:hypothetical protein